MDNFNSITDLWRCFVCGKTTLELKALPVSSWLMLKHEDERNDTQLCFFCALQISEQVTAFTAKYFEAIKKMSDEAWSTGGVAK